MKDLHSHILFGIDDGAKTIEESLMILEALASNGVTDIMLTPHYVENTKFNCDNKTKKQILDILKKECINKNIKINLYLGNEVMINYNIIKNIKDGNISTLNNSKYILIEVPFHKCFEDLDIIFKDLINQGIIPVLAHPERYDFVQKDIKVLDYYLELGVLLQGNYESLFDKYGHSAKKVLKKLIKQKKIHLLGSDIHNLNHPINANKLEKKLLKLVKDINYVDDLLNNNFTKIINNK